MALAGAQREFKDSIQTTCNEEQRRETGCARVNLDREESETKRRNKRPINKNLRQKVLIPKAATLYPFWEMGTRLCQITRSRIAFFCPLWSNCFVFRSRSKPQSMYEV